MSGRRSNLKNTEQVKRASDDTTNDRRINQIGTLSALVIIRVLIEFLDQKERGQTYGILYSTEERLVKYVLQILREIVRIGEYSKPHVDVPRQTIQEFKALEALNTCKSTWNTIRLGVQYKREKKKLPTLTQVLQAIARKGGNNNMRNK